MQFETLYGRRPMHEVEELHSYEEVADFLLLPSRHDEPFLILNEVGDIVLTGDENGFKDVNDAIIAQKILYRFLEKREQLPMLPIDVANCDDDVFAIEYDGTEPFVLLIEAKKYAPWLSLRQAITDATDAFLETESGKDALKCTCGYFNIGDFCDHVPDSFTRNYGFTVTSYLFSEHNIDYSLI